MSESAKLNQRTLGEEPWEEGVVKGLSILYSS